MTRVDLLSLLLWLDKLAIVGGKEANATVLETPNEPGGTDCQGIGGELCGRGAIRWRVDGWQRCCVDSVLAVRAGGLEYGNKVALCEGQVRRRRVHGGRVVRVEDLCENRRLHIYIGVCQSSLGSGLLSGHGMLQEL